MGLKQSEIERTKLFANALDRTSTSCLTVGVLAPIAAVLYNFSGNHTETWVLVLGAMIWILGALALHWMARLALKGLDQ